MSNPEAVKYLRDAYGRLDNIESVLLNLIGIVGMLAGMASRVDPAVAELTTVSAAQNLRLIAEMHGKDLDALANLHRRLTEGLVSLGVFEDGAPDAASHTAACDAISKMTGKQGA
jgi:hypothetical protein